MPLAPMLLHLERHCKTVEQLQLPRAARKKNEQIGILRAKNSLDGWEWGEGERTELRKLDRGEDDAALLRVDFVRLRGVSAHL